MVVKSVWFKYGLSALGLILMLLTFTIPALADPARDERVIDSLIKQQLQGLQRDQLTWQNSEIITSDYRFEGDYAFGIAVVKAAEGIHGEPDMRLFLAKRAGDDWQIALEYTDQFYAWAQVIPDSLMSVGQKQALQNSGRAFAEGVSPRGNGDSRLSLPWATGATWILIGGPHGNNGDSVRPWTGLDLNIDSGSSSSAIRASREGYVYRSSGCPNYVRIDHSDGWQTGYYHVKNIEVTNGQYVERETLLGYTSSQVGCGGWASGPHVHFTLKRNGVYQNIHGNDIGGWTVREGNFAYDGCMVRVRDNYSQCRPAGKIYNEGSIGSGYSDRRYDYNKDNVPDIWAVNQRDTGTNSTSLQIASGNALNTMLASTGTGMPQQPDWLNTAFASADYNGDSVPDLWVMHRWDSANFSAFRIMDGAAPQYLIADKITALPLYDNSVSFAVADYNRDGTPDLWAINPRDTGKNSVSVQIVNGANPKQVLAYSGTPISLQPQTSDLIYAAADYNLDGLPDLWVINPRDNKTKSLSLQVISGANWQKTLVNSGTPLVQQSTNIMNYSVIVADYNYDGYPDLWLYNRKNSKVQIISGKNLTTELFNGSSALPATNTADWHILGSDRARETVAPAAPKANRPKLNSVVTELDTTFRWKPGALTTRYSLTLLENGKIVATKDFPNVDAICAGKWCTVNASTLGYILHDNRNYTWQVIGSNAYGSRSSQVYSFTTDIPGVPVLMSPVNGAVIPGNVTLTWEARPSADNYKIVVKNLPKTYKQKFTNGEQVCNELTCSLTLPELLPVDSYMWKVVAKNSLIAGKSKSEKWYFQVAAVPTVIPTLTSTPQPTETDLPPTVTPSETPPATEPPFPTVTPSDAPIDLPTAAPGLERRGES